MKLIHYILFVVIFLITPLTAQVVIKDNTPALKEFEIGYLYDQSNQLSINDIVKTTFTKTIPNQFSMGYLDGTSWFKITLHNNSHNKEFILYFTEPFWQNLNLYVQKSDDSFTIDKNGIAVELKDRNITDVNPAFLLHLENNETKSIFIEGRSVSGHIGAFEIYTHKLYHQAGRFSLTNAYLFYSAMLTFVFIFTALLFRMTKARLYFYYMFYVLSFIVWIAVLSGYYLYLGFPTWNEGLHATGAIFIGFFILFSAEFLHLKKFYPSYRHVFYIFMYAVFISALLITLKIEFMSQFFNLVSSLFFVFLMFVLFKLKKHASFKYLHYYFIALVIYMPTMGLMTLNFNAIISNTNFTRYAYLFGSFVEILLFTYILLKKFTDIKSEKILLQEQLLEQNARNKRDLEEKIELRTHSLKVKNEELEKQKTKLEKLQKELEKESTIDALSTLYNRRYFNEVSQKFFNDAIRAKDELAVLMLDLDHFKKVNDTYGHVAGDDVIICCANIFKDVVRKSDVVTRYGGEEFVILMPRTNKNSAINLADRINTAVQEKIITTKENQNINVTISIGVAVLKHESDSNIDDILNRADKALYEAKESGRNCVKTL